MSRRSPFASWLCAMLHCFGSYILADLLLGEAPIAYFSHNSSVILATAVCPTKASLYGTVLFTLQQTHWLPISEANLIFFFSMFMIVCKVFMTATHSHASPFAPLENLICPVLFGPVSSGHPSHHHDHHEVSHPPPPPPPAKSKEELNEGTRKRKAKKAE
ncbi:hypothetical protein EK904_008370 [Melospiza melodia maxima]|nr:hypothetical protein EK904_008370 [Melospiza melodia maxima]